MELDVRINCCRCSSSSSTQVISDVIPNVTERLSVCCVLDGLMIGVVVISAVFFEMSKNNLSQSGPYFSDLRETAGEGILHYFVRDWRLIVFRLRLSMLKILAIGGCLDMWRYFL